MRVQVDEARRDDDAAGIGTIGLVGVQPGHGFESTAADDDVGRALSSSRRVDEPGTRDLELRDDLADRGGDGRAPGAAAADAGDAAGAAADPRPPASRYSNAIRIATPFATWSVITECRPAATSGAISTPSFMGPGCMTSTSGDASASRAAVRPNRAAYSRNDGSSAPDIRSRWIRNAITTSASRSASSTDDVTWNRRVPGPPDAAHASNPRSSVVGPHSQRSAPAAVSDQMFERATRECRTSPRITTLRPATDPPGRRCRIV